MHGETIKLYTSVAFSLVYIFLLIIVKRVEESLRIVYSQLPSLSSKCISTTGYSDTLQSMNKVLYFITVLKPYL